MQPSRHFNERMKQRVGLNKSSSSVFLNKAVKYGLTRNDFICRPSFLKYLDSITISDEYELYVYNHYIVVSALTCKVAITILNIPKEFHSTIKSVNKQCQREE